MYVLLMVRRPWNVGPLPCMVYTEWAHGEVDVLSSHLNTDVLPTCTLFALIKMNRNNASAQMGGQAHARRQANVQYRSNVHSRTTN